MKVKQYIIPIISLGFLTIAWEYLVGMIQIESWILPPPSKILVSLWESRQLLLWHSTITVLESLIGLVAAIFIAYIVAIAMYFSHFIKKSLYPLLVISQTIPFIALAPLLTIWFGFGLLPKIIIVALVCFFPIVINLIDGFSQVDSSMIRSLRALGANRYQIFKFAVMPGSMSFFFSGIRIAGSYALLTAVVAEWIGATDGLGVFITRAAKSYLTDRVFAIVLVISVVSLIFITIINQINKRAMPWNIVKN